MERDTATQWDLMHRRAARGVPFLAALKACLAVACIAALAFFRRRTKVSLTAAMSAVALVHAVEALTRRRLRRAIAIVAVILVVAVVLAGLGLLLISPASEQGKALAAEAPAFWRKLQDAPIVARLHLGELPEPGPAAGAVAPVLAASRSVLSALGGLVVFLFLTVFMLVFGRDLATVLLGELRSARCRRFERVGKNTHAVGGYLGGPFGICAINGGEQ